MIPFDPVLPLMCSLVVMKMSEYTTCIGLPLCLRFLSHVTLFTSIAYFKAAGLTDAQRDWEVHSISKLSQSSVTATLLAPQINQIDRTHIGQRSRVILFSNVKIFIFLICRHSGHTYYTKICTEIFPLHGLLFLMSLLY